MAADGSLMTQAIDYKAWAFWFSVIQSLGLVVLSVYVWINNKHKANKDAIDVMKDNLSKDIKGIDERVIKVESCLKHLPSHEDITALNRRVDKVGQGVKGIEGTMKGMNNTVNLINQHLMNGGK